jgi:hypothetical protein
MAVALLAVGAAVTLYQNASQLAQAQSDPYGSVSAERRFAAALSHIPKDVPLAYISDLEIGPKAGTTAFLCAQYAVAPHLLIPMAQGGRHEWAIGNFARQTDYAAAGASAGYRLEFDAGSGAIVYRRSAP